MKRHCSNLLTALIIFFFGCTKEEVTPRVYPRVITVEATQITSAGATFIGEITFSNVEINDHGFLWSIDNSPNIIQANKISLGSKQGIGQFEAKIDRALQDGKKHYLRAYAKSDDFVVYGNIVEFISLGGKAPVVKDFYPSTATWGDTITIVGDNFSDEIRTNVVKFGEEGGPVVRANKDTVFVRVPLFLAKDLTTISVSISGNSSHIEKQFQLRAPEIESVTPDIGLPGTKVVIKGKYLLSAAGSEIHFGETEATIWNWSVDQIETTVPNRPNGIVSLSVRTGTGNLSSSTYFKIQPEHLPELHSVQPAEAKVYQSIKLIGDHFATEPGLTTVKFDNIDAQVLSVSKTEIEVIVPEPETRTPTITVTSYGSSVSIETFTLKSPTFTDYSPHRSVPGSLLTINGTDIVASHLKVFLGDEELQIQPYDNSKINVVVPPNLRNHTATLKVTFYDQEFVLSDQFKSPWIMVEKFPGSDLTSSHWIVNNNNAYLLMAGPPGQANQVWKFNGSQWDRLNDFPVSDRSIAVSFATSDKGYAGAGWVNGTTQVDDLWEYNFATDAWTKQSDMPIPNYPNTGFAIGNEGFAFEVVNHPGIPNLWRYNANTDSWSLRSAAPAGMTGFASTFVIGSSAYVLHSGSSFWRYTPSTNQWTARAMPPVNSSFVFAIGNVGYVGDNNYFAKYNSTTNSWTEELIPYIYGSLPTRAFSINGKGYVVGPAQYGYDNYVYEYDPNY